MNRLSPLAAILTSFPLLACSESTNGVGTISQRMGDAARKSGANEVDLGALTTFGWDSFYAFKPGITREEVCKFLGANRNTCGRVIRIERAANDQTFIVFALQGRVTHVELHALSNGQFDFQFPESWQPRAKSVFKVRRSSSGNSETILLEPK